MSPSRDTSRRSERVFVLRVLASASGQSNRGGWRFLLEDPFSKARRGFADLESLTTFLAAQVPIDTSRHDPGPKRGQA